MAIKIEINLDDIFCDKHGHAGESTKDLIRRQVLDLLTAEYREQLFKRFDDQLAEIMQSQIHKAIKLQMPSLVNDIMNAEFISVSTFGQRSKPTTLKAEIINAIGSELFYKFKVCSNAENAFTKAVKGVAEQTKAIQDALIAEIDESFNRDAIAFAVTRLQERLGLPK